MFLLFLWAYPFLNILSFLHYNKKPNSLFPWVSSRFQKLDDSHLSVKRLIILFLSFLKQPSSGCFIFSQTTIQCSSHLFFSAQPCIRNTIPEFTAFLYVEDVLHSTESNMALCLAEDICKFVLQLSSGKCTCLL